MNRFAYAANNPLRFRDRSGMQYEGVSQYSSDWNFSYTNMNMSLFEMDRQVFFSQLREWNATRFKRYEREGPALYIALGRNPSSIAALPHVTPQDYPSANLAIPPFAALPAGESVEANIRAAGSPFNTKAITIDHPVQAIAEAFYELAGVSKFAWEVAPRSVVGRLGGGRWDYKADSPYSTGTNYLIAMNAGNFNYGAVGASLGFSLERLLQFAGGLNVAENFRNEEYASQLKQGRYGTPFRVAPYGDFPVDQYWIIRGYYYYHQDAAGLNSYLESLPYVRQLP
jgi:Bacterial toxin 44